VSCCNFRWHAVAAGCSHWQRAARVTWRWCFRGSGYDWMLYREMSRCQPVRRRHTLSFRTTRTQQSFIASLLDFEVCCLQYKTTGKSTWVGQLRACGVQAQVGLHLRNVQCQLRATLSREVFVSGCLLLLRRYDFSYRTMLYIARTMLLQDVRPSGGVECKGIWKNHDFRPISRFIS